MNESALAMAERTIRRLWITILVLIVLMAGMATGFFIYESQFEEESYEIEQEVDTENGTAVVSGVGDAIYGESKTEDQN
jgi:hypothetical protein